MPQVIFEKKDRIAYLTINRPEKMNALNAEVVNGLNAAWHDIENDKDVWCTIVTGTGGRAFSAGADLKEMSDRRKGAGEGLLASIRAAGFWRTSDLTKPVIAAVDGYCLAGGLELALACDFIIASDRSHFGLSEVLRAIIPGGGGTQRLPRAIPFRRALEVLLTGDRLNAQQAYDLGLVNRVVKPEDVMSTAEELANKINANGPLAVRAIKQLAYQGMDMPLEQGLRLEELVSQRIHKTEDSKEGPLAFVEKRKPNYKGR